MADFQNDLEILNYALTLEHLENTMYQMIVASGKLTGQEQTYATNFGKDEAAHVQALTQTIQKLNGTPVQAQAKYNFPAFDTRDNIVKFLVTVEDLGAAAYLGAAPEIQNGDILTAAVSIHNVEGEHASVWRRQAKMMPVVGAFASPATKAQVLSAVGPILGSSTTAAAGTSTTGTATTGTARTGTATVGTATTGTPRTGTATTGTATTGTVATATAPRPTATTSVTSGTTGGTTGNTGPVATGTGGGTTPTTLPTTGQPHSNTNNGVAAAVVAGIAVVGAGAALRARSYKREARPSDAGDK